MCRLHTEGISFGCGHYIVTSHLSKDDCHNQFCMNSELHPERRCNGCGETCKRYYDPDATQSIIDDTNAYCTLCDYWFKGAGAKRVPIAVLPVAGEVILAKSEPHRRREPITVSPAGGEVIMAKSEPQRRRDPIMVSPAGGEVLTTKSEHQRRRGPNIVSPAGGEVLMTKTESPRRREPNVVSLAEDDVLTNLGNADPQRRRPRQH